MLAALTWVAVIAGAVALIALAMPVLIALIERYYSAYAEWVWEKMGVR